jgi:hypothetical protein
MGQEKELIVSEIFPILDSVVPISPHEQSHLNIDCKSALKEAEDFILRYHWVQYIENEYIGAAFDGIIYIFLFNISSNRAEVDPWLWVVVGDVPSAYITCESARTPYEALDAYLGAMEEWVAAARDGKPVSELIPVNVAPTKQNAEMLNVRLAFLDQKIRPLIR